MPYSEILVCNASCINILQINLGDIYGVTTDSGTFANAV